MNRQHALDGLRRLEQDRNQRESLIAQQDIEPLIPDEEDSDCPIFDSFSDAGGDDSICRMINFTPREFSEIYKTLETCITAKRNVGRGKKYKEQPKDILFMLLAKRTAVNRRCKI